MRRLFLVCLVTALAAGRPETYREKEDFQYSRSSTDEGSKSGYYGAQRGNMGGNYERAHNMDGLAQNQMSGLVRQVEGELGDASKARTGSVYSAANSRGMYGSGKYDLSNLEGRNFQEGVSYGDAQSLAAHNTAYSSHSSAASASHAAGYTNNHFQNSRYNGYKAAGHSGQLLQTDNLQTADRLRSAGGYEYGNQESSGYHSQQRYQGRNGYDQHAANQHSAVGYGANAQSRLISTGPVRVVLRPGTQVHVPVVAQTYDSTKSTSAFDQNAINTEAEVLNSGQPIYDRPKHYESSYKYKKEWEKHDTKPVAVPLAIPTLQPFAKNGELSEDVQAAHTSDAQYQSSGSNSQSTHSNNAYRGYNTNVKAASGYHQSGYDAHLSSRSSNMNALNAQGHDSLNANNAALTELVANTDSKPKGYHSSYAYHKSWERQGDPYIIEPSTNSLHSDQTSQKLTSSQIHQGGYSSHQYGSHSKQHHQSYTHGEATEDCDCDENGYVRVARSVNENENQEEYESQEEVGQKAQSHWQNIEDLGQQTQSMSGNLEDFGQQEQSEDLGQQTQSLTDNLENFGQQEQSEDLGQQTQSLTGNLEIFGQQEQSEDLGQQTQSLSGNLENFGQQSEDLGQQTQSLNTFTGSEQWKNMQQQSQGTWGKLETGGQQVQNHQQNIIRKI